MTALLLACLLVLPAAGDGSAEQRSTKPKVVELMFERSTDQLSVVMSFRLENAITDHAMELIESGIEVIFRHKVRILVRRDVPLTPRKELARTKILDGKCWTVPVLSGGRVYARNSDGDVVCVDLRK